MACLIRIASISEAQVRAALTVLINITGPESMYRDKPAIKVIGDDSKRAVIDVHGFHVIRVIKGV